MKYDLVILAAGLGSRFKSKTNNYPKAMVKYKGKRFIEIQLNNINKNKINKYIIVLGYKSIQLKQFLEKTFSNIKFTFIYNKNYLNNNSAQSFFYAYKKITTHQYIHLNCDCIFSKSHFNKLLNSKHKNVISVRSDIKLGDKMENVETSNKKIIKMSLIKTENSNYKAYGVAKISKKAMFKNIDLYKKLSSKEKKLVNYYTLIRKNLKKVDYKLLNSNKYNLCEANSQKELKKFKLTDI